MSQTGGSSSGGINWGNLLGPALGALGSSFFGQTPTGYSGPLGPQAQQNALNQWLGLEGTLQGSNPYSQVGPYAQSVFGSQFNNPYASGYQTSANAAGANSTGVGNMALGSAGPLNSTVLAGLIPALNTLQMGFDPQNALYNRTQQQVGDQLNAQLANMGLQSSPAGAGIFAKGNSDFNIDWQNNLLSRALQSLQGFGQFTGQAANSLTGASNLGGAGVQDLLFGGQAPWTTSNDISGNQGNAINSLLSYLTGGQGYNQQLLGNWNSLLGLGQTQNQQALAALEQQQQSQAAQQQGLGSLFGPAISAGVNYLFNNANDIFSGIGNAISSIF